MKYLFIYLNQIISSNGNSTILELACSNHTVSPERYVRYIKPDNYRMFNESKFKNSILKNDLARGISLRNALLDILQIYKNTDVLVMWDVQQFTTLVKALKQNKLGMVGKHFILLQPIIAHITQQTNCSLNEYLTLLNIRSYNSSIDANVYLLQIVHIFDLIFPFFKKECNGKEIPSILMMERHFNRVNIPYRQFKLSECESVFSNENINALCKCYKLNCHIGANVIFISSNFSQWRVIHNDYCIDHLDHKSMRWSFTQKQDNHNFKSGYHIQNIDIGSLHGILSYINGHDIDYFKKKNMKNNLVDTLLCDTRKLDMF